MTLVSSVIQFDKFFHPVVLYENYLICIFMNINEILKMMETIVCNGVIRVSKGAKIRNRYNQVPHLTQDTNGRVTNSQ